MSTVEDIDGEFVKEDGVAIRLKVPSSSQAKDSGINDGIDGPHKQKYNRDEREFEKESRHLRHRLKIYFYAAVKYKSNVCSFQAIYFIFMLLQILKVALITAQMFKFGDDRVDFNNVVHRGHLTLRHLLLKDWDASWETLPYPPAQGDFAVYDIEALKEKINYAVTNLFNAEADAIGYFHRLETDNVTAEMTYFDFGGLKNTSSKGRIQIKQTAFNVIVDEVKTSSTTENSAPENTTPVADSTTTVTAADNGTTTKTTPIADDKNGKTNPADNGDIHYTYDIDKDFERNNLMDPIKSLLTITLHFIIYSVRVDITSKKARCLRINGWIHFKDPDNNGQVIEDLETLTRRIKCSEMNFDVEDRELETVEIGLSVMVILIVMASMTYTVLSVIYGVYVMARTKKYMKKYYQKVYQPEDPSETDLPFWEYARFFKGWDLIVIIADFTTIFGTFGMILELRDASWTIASLEQYAVGLGIGCILAWVGLLRYLKFNYKFHLLFSTMYSSIWDVLAYLACITILFVGYLSFGYVVIGPYHFKFRTASDAGTTLFALINGDEIYATFALLDEGQTGGPLVPFIYKLYIGSYVAIFTIIVINLLIALFTNAYDSVKEQYENPEQREEGPMERALKQLLTSDEEGENKQLKGNFYNFLKEDQSMNRFSFMENKLRTELRKTLRISEKQKKIILKKPKTLKAFILDEDKEEVKPTHCCCVLSCLRLYGSSKDDCFF